MKLTAVTRDYIDDKLSTMFPANVESLDPTVFAILLSYKVLRLLKG